MHPDQRVDCLALENMWTAEGDGTRTLKQPVCGSCGVGEWVCCVLLWQEEQVLFGKLEKRVMGWWRRAEC